MPQHISRIEGDSIKEKEILNQFKTLLSKMSQE